MGRFAAGLHNLCLKNWHVVSNCFTSIVFGLTVVFTCILGRLTARGIGGLCFGFFEVNINMGLHFRGSLLTHRRCRFCFFRLMISPRSFLRCWRLEVAVSMVNSLVAAAFCLRGDVSSSVPLMNILNIVCQKDNHNVVYLPSTFNHS